MIGINTIGGSYWVYDTDYPDDYSQAATPGDARRQLAIYLNVLGWTSTKVNEYMETVEIKPTKKTKVTYKPRGLK